MASFCVLQVKNWDGHNDEMFVTKIIVIPQYNSVRKGETCCLKNLDNLGMFQCAIRF